LNEGGEEDEDEPMSFYQEEMEMQDDGWEGDG